MCVCVCDVLSLSEPPFEVVLPPDGWSGCLERELPRAPGSAPYRPYQLTWLMCASVHTYNIYGSTWVGTTVNFYN